MLALLAIKKWQKKKNGYITYKHTYTCTRSRKYTIKDPLTMVPNDLNSGNNYYTSDCCACWDYMYKPIIFCKCKKEKNKRKKRKNRFSSPYGVKYTWPVTFSHLINTLLFHLVHLVLDCFAKILEIHTDQSLNKSRCYLEICRDCACNVVPVLPITSVQRFCVFRPRHTLGLGN